MAIMDDLEESDDELLVPTPEFSIVDPDQELADSLHVDLGWLARCTDLLRDRPQLIFYGPPGTGKTYIAKTLARHLAGPDNVTIVQFHPAYSYEDFFEGFRPTPRSDGQVGFELEPGPMRRLTDRARTHPDQLFVLVVDEINRGNLAKIFGELYFLLEYRDEAIDLMYSSDKAEPFHSAAQCGDHLPRSSTADRSIALVDTAMRRRFGFVPLHPAQEPTNSSPERLAHRPHVPAACRGPAPCLEHCNRRSGRTCSDSRISCVRRCTVMGDWRRYFGIAIFPLLEEFHFGDPAVDLDARYGLAALEKSLTTGE